MSENAVIEYLDRAREALNAGNHLEAAALFREAATHARRVGLDRELAYALRHAALAELETERFEQAMKDGYEAVEIYDALDSGDGLDYANTLRVIAIAKEGLGRQEQARDDWEAARAIYLDCGIEEGVTECDAHLTQRTAG